MRVALFGGSFNPPHVAHQLVALYVLETEPVDELWMIPCFKHPFDKDLAPFADRLSMCRLAAAPLGKRVRVSEVEGDLGGDSRTLRTIKELQRRFPEHAFSLVIGADLEEESKSWYGADELRRLVPFVVVGRPGFSQQGVVMPDISSTEVRGRLAARDWPTRLVSRAVLDFIREKRLYEPPVSS